MSVFSRVTNSPQALMAALQLPAIPSNAQAENQTNHSQRPGAKLSDIPIEFFYGIVNFSALGVDPKIKLTQAELFEKLEQVKAGSVVAPIMGGITFKGLQTLLVSENYLNLYERLSTVFGTNEDQYKPNLFYAAFRFINKPEIIQEVLSPGFSTKLETLKEFGFETKTDPAIAITLLTDDRYKDFVISPEFKNFSVDFKRTLGLDPKKTLDSSYLLFLATVYEDNLEQFTNSTLPRIKDSIGVLERLGFKAQSGYDLFMIMEVCSEDRNFLTLLEIDASSFLPKVKRAIPELGNVNNLSSFLRPNDSMQSMLNIYRRFKSFNSADDPASLIDFLSILGVQNPSDLLISDTISDQALMPISIAPKTLLGRDKPPFIDFYKRIQIQTTDFSKLHNAILGYLIYDACHDPDKSLLAQHNLDNFILNASKIINGIRKHKIDIVTLPTHLSNLDSTASIPEQDLVNCVLQLSVLPLNSTDKMAEKFLDGTASKLSEALKERWQLAPLSLQEFVMVLSSPEKVNFYLSEENATKNNQIIDLLNLKRDQSGAPLDNKSPFLPEISPSLVENYGFFINGNKPVVDHIQTIKKYFPDIPDIEYRDHELSTMVKCLLNGNYEKFLTFAKTLDEIVKFNPVAIPDLFVAFSKNNTSSDQLKTSSSLSLFGFVLNTIDSQPDKNDEEKKGAKINTVRQILNIPPDFYEKLNEIFASVKRYIPDNGNGWDDKIISHLLSFGTDVKSIENLQNVFRKSQFQDDIGAALKKDDYSTDSLIIIIDKHTGRVGIAN